MKFTTQIEVMGMKFSKGTMENGQAYDSTKVYVKTDLDGSKGQAIGAGAAEYLLGKSEEYQKYVHLGNVLPIMCEADCEIVTNGKTTKTLIHAMRPIASAKPAVSASKNGAA